MSTRYNEAAQLSHIICVQILLLTATVSAVNFEVPPRNVASARAMLMPTKIMPMSVVL